MDQEFVSFLALPENTDFTLYNIPFGVCSVDNKATFPATIIGNYVIRLDVFERLGLLCGPLFTELRTQGEQIFVKNLDKFISLNKPYWQEVRQTLQQGFQCGSSLETNQEHLGQLLLDVNQVKYHLPCQIGEYTDFYSSKNHAFNIGSILRGAGNELQSNWVHLPVGYHGRRSTIVATDTDIRRPWGQVKAPTAENPSFAVCKRLDFELEIGAILGGESNKLGNPIRIHEAEDRIFGLVLLNDWSARDFQAWEYIPLGPFTAKNLMTTISPWIVTTDALRPHKIDLEKQEPQPFEYLRGKEHTSYDLNLEVHLKTQKSDSYQKFIDSCTMEAGDILGSGTISGKTRDSRGCMMEYTWNGKEPLELSNGETRLFLEDHDTIEMRGFAGDGSKRVGFGNCRGTVIPALPKEYFDI